MSTIRAIIRYGGQLSQTSPGFGMAFTFGAAMGARYPCLRRENEEPSPKLGKSGHGSQRGQLAVRAEPKSGSVAHRRQHAALVEIEEAVLVGADLVDVDVVVAGIDELPDFLQVLFGIGATDEAFGDRLHVDQFGALFEVGGEGQLEKVVAADAAVGPVLQRRLTRLVL